MQLRECTARDERPPHWRQRYGSRNPTLAQLFIQQVLAVHGFLRPARARSPLGCVTSKRERCQAPRSPSRSLLPTSHINSSWYNRLNLLPHLAVDLISPLQTSLTHPAPLAPHDKASEHAPCQLLHLPPTSKSSEQVSLALVRPFLQRKAIADPMPSKTRCYLLSSQQAPHRFKPLCRSCTPRVTASRLSITCTRS